MHHLAVARTHLRRDDPDVFGEVHLHQNVLVVDRAGRRNVEVLRHLDDHVRLDVPAVLEGDGGRLVLRVAFGRSAVRPSGERLDLGIAQAGGRSRSGRNLGSANHGGICRLTTAVLIAFAHGRVLS